MTFLSILAAVAAYFILSTAYTKAKSTAYVKSRPRLEAIMSKTSLCFHVLADLVFYTAVIVYIASLLRPMSPWEIAGTFALVAAWLYLASRKALRRKQVQVK